MRVITQHMGGGFGSKLGADALGLICARLAKEAGVPVKLMLDRKEEHLATGNRPSATARIKAGVAADGMLTAFDADTVGHGRRRRSGRFSAALHLPVPQPAPHRTSDVFINTGQQRPMRAPGHPQGSFITEVLMDELADRVKMDPVEFRIKNLPPEAPERDVGRLPAPRRDGVRLGQAAPDRRPAPGPVKKGMGVAINTWGGGGRGPSQARCEISSDGVVVVKVGTQDLGTGTRTLIAVVAADTLRPSGRAPSVRRSATPCIPISGASGGSTTAAAVSPAVRIADGERARRAEGARGSGARSRSRRPWWRRADASMSRTTRRKGLSWADACKQLATQPIAVEGNWQPGLSSVTTSGVQFAEVSVDIETGIVKVARVLAIQDCGLVVSRLTAESQVYGGVVGSLNFALYEDRILDRNTGQMVNPNMEWYLLAGMSDIPKIDVRLVDQPERGVIGIGEPPTVSTAAAITNAVRNAIGATVRSLPLTPARILQTLAQQRA